MITKGLIALANHDPKGWTPAVGGIAFAGVGGSIMAFAWWVGRRASREAVYREQFPDQPWKWKPEWAAGEIPDQTGQTAFRNWAISLFIMIFTVPIVVLVATDPKTTHNKAAYLVLLFPLVGLLFLAKGIQETLRRRRFGVSTFVPQSLPLAPGTTVIGTILTPTPFETPEGVTLRLVAIHKYVTGSGDNSSTHETVQWEDEQTVRPKTLRGVDGMQIPVQFNLPANVPVSDYADSNNLHLWRLTAKASLPGPDYWVQFEVPVFVDPDRVADAADANRDAAEAVVVLKPADNPLIKPTERGIFATERRDGGWDFHFAAGRNKGSILVWIVVEAMIVGGAVFLVYSGLGYHGQWKVVDLVFSVVPLFMALGFSGFALLLALVIYSMLFVQSDVTVSHGSLTRVSSSPLHSRTKKFNAGDVKEIAISISGSTGDKNFYAVKVVPKIGYACELATGISSKRDAQWLADRMTQSLGLSVTPVEQVSR